MAAQRTLLSGHARPDPSLVQLLKVPDVAPPFDGDALPASPAARAGLPLGSVALSRLPAVVPRADQVLARERAPFPAQQFARLLVETLAGARPPWQLRPWLADRAQAHLRRVASALRCGQRPRVLRVLVSRPDDNVVEMSVIIGLESRIRALAVRLEETAPARWLCTDIETA
ncbi:MAG: hypothetical protein J2P25_13740 [Nocardiopsaceae bacterium]|nr:hypothetical protein [Nocardiopsaceae bacterium]